MMTLQPLGPEELTQVESLVSHYPYKSYRYYRVFPRRAQLQIMLAEIEATLRHADGFVLRAAADGSGAIAVARALAWDSAFFGVAMGRIEYLCASHRDLLVPAIDASLKEFQRRGVRHVSARVDVADIEQAAALESRGFRLMDALVTYTTRPIEEPPNPVREVGVIRDFRPSDGPALLEIAREAYRGFRGRFHLDQHLPHDRCDAFYVEWAKQCLAGTMADTVLVSEGTDGRLLGFLAFRRREPVSTVGRIQVFGGGLGACRADTPGAYAGLIRAGTVWAHERRGVAECQTQNYNFPTIRIYEAVGAHYVRAEYTLHCWLH